MEHMELIELTNWQMRKFWADSRECNRFESCSRSKKPLGNTGGFLLSHADSTFDVPLPNSLCFEFSRDVSGATACLVTTGRTNPHSSEGQIRAADRDRWRAGSFFIVEKQAVGLPRPSFRGSTLNLTLYAG